MTAKSLTIAVTGATGFLGSHLLERLTCEIIARTPDAHPDKYRIIALKRADSNLSEVQQVFGYYGERALNRFDLIQWRTADMLDPASLKEAVAEADVIFHCAAIVSFDPRDRNRLIQNNISVTENMIAAAEGKRLIHVSSTSALGDSPGNDPGFLIDEDCPRNPQRPHSGYSVSKYESEKLVRAAIEKGLDAFIVNPGIILGPGFWDRGSSQLFTRMKKGLPFYTRGGTGYVDVRDLVDIMVRILLLPNLPHAESDRRFCLVGANAFYRDFFNLVADSLGVDPPPFQAGPFLSGVAWRLDTLKARLTGSYPLITRETAESANRISFYNNKKVKKYFIFTFRTLEETVNWVCSKV